MIRKLTIAGFRGILAPLVIDLAQGGKPRSLVLYGRNGTGKSSVVDGWEWFWSSRIEHLAREGAGPTSYPHRESADAETFVEIEFASAELGTVRKIFHHDRPASPTAIGSLGLFKQRTPHPCHIRFADLTRFVYLQKAERYDLLARLMGFSRQVEIQKELRRTEKLLRQELDRLRDQLKEIGRGLRRSLQVPELTERELVSAANPLLAAHELPTAANLAELTLTAGKLTARIQRDPDSKILEQLSALGRQVKVIHPAAALPGAVQAYAAAVRPFKSREQTFAKLLLIDLYERGVEFLSTSDKQGQCPMCGQSFDGDLSAHIRDELRQLRDLRDEHASVERARAEAMTVLQPAHGPAPIQESLRKIASDEVINAGNSFLTSLRAVDEHRSELLTLCSIQSRDLDDAALSVLRATIDKLATAVTLHHNIHRHLLDLLARDVRRLRADTKRARLVQDAQRLTAALDAWDQYLKVSVEGIHLRRVSDQFSAIVTSFVDASTADVLQRFDRISDDVATFFAILEERTLGIEKPVLRLLVDQDRAVVPEVTFFGSPVSPAYRYLSESQLCSFGLAVFFASVRHFNPMFHVLVLDDVINSLDGYKRPQVIKLLKEHFSDFQVILTTHDSAWRDRLHKAFPSWRKVHFIRIDYGIGPITAEGLPLLQEIKESIRDDKPVQAGQALGPYIELQLQEICDRFEVEVKYNQRNEYTLEPLLDRLRVRAQKKLGASHVLTTALKSLQEETGFRNLCAHAKDPAIQLTPEEMALTLEKWEDVERLVRCQADECASVLQYVSDGRFRCPCGGSVLERA